MRLNYFLFFAFLFSQTIHGQEIKLKTGDWTGSLKLNDSTALYFKFTVKTNKNKKEPLLFEIINADETIPLNTSYRKENDSIDLTFPFFNSFLVLLPKGDTCLIGYWKNKNKGDHYTIPCTIKYGYSSRFPSDKNHSECASVEGKWESVFSPGTDDAEKTIGLFKQQKNILTGTFLTETGDYRFLEGNVFKDNLYLSCFDGSHAFLFTANIVGNELMGQFYSGKHYNTRWSALRNDAFMLTHPDSLTIHDETKEFTFSIQDLEGKIFTYPNESYENKVVLIQIMGTWCPNCMDETIYLQELYTKYHDKGLEIISVAYEAGNSRDQQVDQIQKLIDKRGLEHLFLLGGTASKKLAAEQFKTLNNVISFPTTIFIDRSGKIQKIHTGFNGPGTGDFYKAFTTDTNTFIEQLLRLN